MAPVTSGFHFTPTKKEILNKFLTRKAKGEPLPTRLVVEKNIYNDQSPPWDIFTKNEPWLPDGSEFSKKHVIYVYTKLSYVSKATTTDKRGPKNVKRRSGRGSWSGQRGDDVFNSNQEVIGYCRKFTYEPDKNWLDLDTMRKQYGSWIMHEYSLKGINGSSDYVFCKIMLNLSSKDGAAPGLLNEGIRVIEQEDMVALINNSSQNNAASTSVVPFLPSMMMSDQEKEKEEGNITDNLETNIVSNDRWIPESTYGYNNDVSFEVSDDDIIQLVDDNNNNVSRKKSQIYGPDMGLNDFQNHGASDPPVNYFTDIFIGEDENGFIYCK